MGEIKAALQKFEQLGMDCGFFVNTTIGAIDKTSCPASTIPAVDYDKCKEKFCSARGMKDYKSCDALKFIADYHRLDFIEMKSTEKLIAYNQGKNAEKIASNAIERFSLIDKLLDSFLLLHSLLRCNEFKFTDNEIQLIQEANYKYFVLVDSETESDPIKVFAVTLDHLAQASNDLLLAIQEKINDKLSELNRYKNLSSGLISCSKLHSIYGN